MYKWWFINTVWNILYMLTSAQYPVPDCVWTSSSNSFQYHTWVDDTLSTFVEITNQNLQSFVSLCGSSHSPSLSFLSGGGRDWLPRDVTPASSSSTQKRPRLFRSWRGTKPMLSRWVWMMHAAQRSVSEDTSNSYWSDKKPKGSMMKWSADQDKCTEGGMLHQA